MNLTQKLDKQFSLFIRQRDAVGDYSKCVTCGKTQEWKKMDCGHYWSRRYKGTRWEEKNCAIQCKGCNLFNQGASPQFTLYLIEKYGEEVLTLLAAKKNSLTKLADFELKELIKIYKQKTDEIQKNGN